jgi:hypothetical protein
LSVIARPYHEVLQLNSVKNTVDQHIAQNVVVLRLLMPALDKIFEATVRNRTRLAGTQALITVRRYILTHSAPPPDRETAVREAGLAGVPTDAYSGQPIRFKLVNGKPIVYSVGRDQKDDGGATDAKFESQPGDYIFRLSN